MTLMIPDELLKQAGLTAREALTEFACHLFDTGKLTLYKASQLAQLSRDEFQAELMDRKIPIFRPTQEDFQHDRAALKKIGL